MNFLDPRLPDRFWSKCTPEPMSGCWLWTGGTDRKGYGDFYRPRRGRVRASSKAHRVSYELLVGPIPDGLHLDHLCRVRCCVNPAHLEPVTPRENTLRGVGITAQQARRTVCPRGHEYDDRRHCVKCQNIARHGSRDRLAAAGLCVNAPGHGPATRGLQCAACAERRGAIEKAKRARKRKPAPGWER